MLVIHCPLSLLLFIFVPFQWLFHFTVFAFPKQMPHYLHSEKLSTSTEESKRLKITFKSPTAAQRLKTSLALHHRKRGLFLLFWNVNVHYEIYIFNVRTIDASFNIATTFFKDKNKLWLQKKCITVMYSWFFFRFYCNSQSLYIYICVYVYTHQCWEVTRRTTCNGIT